MATPFLVLFAATACAYQVQLTDEDGSIIDDYTAGNALGDSQAYVHPAEGVGLAKMQAFARQTATETAQAAGLEPTAIHEDRELIAGLEELYGNWPED